jgi:putative flippase GtrA
MAEPEPGRSPGVQAKIKDALPAATRWQLIRYLGAGGLVASVYLGLTLILSGPAGFPIQAAIPVSYATALCLHFSLQRWFVFRNAEEFALAMHHQVGRYLLIALFQYACTAIATALLPDALGVSSQVVYVVTAVLLAGVTFLLLRTRVFHAPSE